MARGKWRTLLAGALGLSLALPLLPTGGSIAQADETVYDGHDAAHAAASCYEIKQLNPKATSGAYWLLTDQMSEPQQFYCDQEYDGGGWVLIGRGRNGWLESYNGRGKASDLLTGNAPEQAGKLVEAEGKKSVQLSEGFSASAFSPVQLPSTTVNALLNNDTDGSGIRPDDLEDGIRIRRALNVEGTAWQEATVQRLNTERWSWTLRARANWGKYTVKNLNERYTQYDVNVQRPASNGWGGEYPYNTTIHDSSDPGAFANMSFIADRDMNYEIGFVYGNNTPVTSSDEEYLMQDQNSFVFRKKNSGKPQAYAQMYLRPKLTQQDLNREAIADSGSAGFERRALHNSYSEPVKWRTNGEAGTPGVDSEKRPWKKNEFHTQVQAITQVGNTVFTGGDFEAIVNENPKDDEPRSIQQKYLVGYDVNSVEPVKDFKIDLNGQVKSLAALPDNRLAIGGEFTSVNGQPIQGFVVVDAATGAIDSSWTIRLQHRAGSLPQGRALKVIDGKLYIAGSFTNVRDAHSTVATGNIIRVDIASKSIDTSWTPAVNGLITAVDAREDNSEVFIAGYFTRLETDDTGNSFGLAALKGYSNPDGKVYLAQKWSWQPSDTYSRITEDQRPNIANMNPRPQFTQWGYQHGVLFDGENVWTAGTEHMMSIYRGQDLSYRINSSISRNGGDFQDLYLDKSTKNTPTVFTSCHCGDFIYHGADNVNNPWNQDYTQIDTIRLVGAYDQKSGSYLPEFDPKIVGFHGLGIWETFVDSRGILWVGGDIAKSLGANGMQNTVGFARYAQRDSSAPEAPTDLKVEHELDGLTRTAYDKLSWQKVGDQKARYQILRNDRVIATTYSTSIRLPYEPNARYFARAADPAGNYSASTPVASLPALAPGVLQELDATRVILDGSEAWFYAPVSADMPSDWTTQNLKDIRGDDTWKPAWAPFGWGNAAGLKTQLDRPKDSLGFYARRGVHLTKEQSRVPLQLITRADDGIVLYVNGHEVFRKNLREGEVRYNSYANAIPDSSKGISSEIVEVPAEYLQEGSNVIAAQVQANWAGSPNLSFSLAAVSLLGRTPVTPADQGPRAVNTQTVTSVLSGDEEWSYRTTISDPVSSWNSASEEQWRADLPEDQQWLSGKAPLGWGNAPVNTRIERQTERSKQELGFYARRSVQLSAEQAAADLQLMTWADDGIVVYVNGHEVFRKNLREGRLSPRMYATAAPDILSERVTDHVRVPAEYLREGENVIAVQVQANWRRSPNVSFGMTAHSTLGQKAQEQPEQLAEAPAEDAPAEQPQPEQPVAREEG